jgi:acyl-CoA synthetase (AMP-forming)/AMP-acid ligase II
MFRRRLAADPDSPFLQLPDGRSWTFRDIDALSSVLEKRLWAHSVRSGDVVGLYQWNEPSWFVSVLAAWKVGGVAALCGAVSPAAEAVRRFELVRPKVVISSDAPDLSSRWGIIEVDLSGRIQRESPSDPDVVEPFVSTNPDADDSACIFFTSGTTGDAKALVKSHSYLASAPRQTAETYSRSPSFRPRMAGADKPPGLSFNPFGQSASFGRLVFRLYIGRPLVMIRKFNVDTVKQLAERYPLDTLQLTPAMVHMLAFTDSEINLSSLKYVNSGTAPLSLATREAFEKRFGVPVLQAYGSTEGGVTALERYEDVIAGLRGPGSVGRITPESEWRIVDAFGNDVAVGEEGEILGRPNQRTILTAEGESNLPVDEEGWYHTGDGGRVDEHGILYLIGRLKEMMIVGGFNVFPAEVEDAMRESPSVRDTVVVSIPDERLGEIPVAGIVWEPEAEDETDVERIRGLISEVRSRLAAYKVPRRWFSIVQVPLTPNGKVDRLAAVRAAEMNARTVDELEKAGANGDQRGA